MIRWWNRQGKSPSISRGAFLYGAPGRVSAGFVRAPLEPARGPAPEAQQGANRRPDDNPEVRLRFRIPGKEKARRFLDGLLLYGAPGRSRTSDLWFVARRSIQLSYGRKSCRNHRRRRGIIPADAGRVESEWDIYDQPPPIRGKLAEKEGLLGPFGPRPPGPRFARLSRQLRWARLEPDYPSSRVRISRLPAWLSTMLACKPETGGEGGIRTLEGAINPLLP